MLLPRARLDLGAIAMKEYSAFPKAPALQELHPQIVLCTAHSLGGVFLLLYKKAFGFLGDKAKYVLVFIISYEKASHSIFFNFRQLLLGKI